MTEWKTYRLGDIAKFQTGRLNSNAAVENGKYPFFTCSPNTLAIDNYAFDKEAILLAGNNAEGNFSIKYYKGKFNAYQRTYIIETYNDICDIKFLFYALKLCLQQFKLMSQGTSTKFLTAVILNNFEISLPSLEEQRRIAGILGAIDDKIECNRRINTNLELQAQALFEEIFFSDNDWEYTTLGMLTEEVKTKVSGMDAKVLSPISSGELVLSEDYFTKQVYSQDTSKYIVVEPKTFAYNPARINIGSIGINSFDFIGCVSPVYVVFKTKSEYENYFRLFVKSDIFKEEVKSRAIGGVRQTLSYRDFAMITTKHPPIESIRTFNDQYNTLLDIINHNNTENRVLATLRDTLLPKLMNGEMKL